MTTEPFACGIIFDMDGVLIDSEGLYYRAYSEVLKPYGVTVSRAEYEEYWIAQGNGPEYVVAKYNLPVSPDELRELRSPLYLRFLETEVTLMPHVKEALTRLAPHFSLIVATNSNREHLDFVLHRLPLPDAFLTAAEKLGLPPTRCVVIEDTYKGVMAAANAGITCIAVPNEHTLHNDFSRASLVLPSLGELTPAVVHSLLD